ncbi:hypothetical protein NC653_038754 [Populus alba x Populus x berolinensis]|uniref:Uncharacterized protein n=1 Tax=Populus alba x Populus x berolinensis TaxID=444605 RepID=A0AAD6LHN6_9ROSI|nr:hypothetical protein NC653_038754 [Populus alba x Populus x berolinensis]
MLINNSSTYRKLRYKTHGLIMDFICTSGLCVAAEPDIPVTFSLHLLLAFLPFFLCFPTLHQSYTESFRHMKDFLDIPSLPPILATDTTRPAYFLDVASQFPQVARIMINTFELLESKADKATSDGLCGAHHQFLASVH